MARMEERFECPVGDDWARHRAEAEIALQKVDEMHSGIESIIKHTEHLQKLDTINEGITVLASEMRGLSSQHRDILRWLLAVVCIIALGKGTLELVDRMWPNVAKVSAEEPATP